MEKIYFNGSYISTKDQKYIFPNAEIYNTFNISDRKPRKSKYYRIKYIIKNIYHNAVSSERSKADIQIFNSIVGCFFYDKKKTNVLLLHSYDIGIGSHFLLQNTHSTIKKILIRLLDFLVGGFIQRQIHKFDYVFAATMDRYIYLKNIYPHTKFLPNIISVISPKKNRVKKVNNKICTVFCPERVDTNKGLEIRKHIILYLYQQDSNLTFSMIHRGFQLEGFKQRLDHIGIKNIERIEYMNTKDLHQKIYHSDLVIGIFNNGSLSCTNMETMLLQTPIITYDKREVIKNTKKNILEYTKKIYHDDIFRNNEVKKNYQYIIKKHSLEEYKKIISTVVSKSYNQKN